MKLKFNEKLNLMFDQKWNWSLIKSWSLMFNESWKVWTFDEKLIWHLIKSGIEVWYKINWRLNGKVYGSKFDESWQRWIDIWSKLIKVSFNDKNNFQWFQRKNFLKKQKKVEKNAKKVKKTQKKWKNCVLGGSKRLEGILDPKSAKCGTSKLSAVAGKVTPPSGVTFGPQKTPIFAIFSPFFAFFGVFLHFFGKICVFNEKFCYK